MRRRPSPPYACLRPAPPAADEDEDFEARLAALKKAKGETPYGARRRRQCHASAALHARVCVACVLCWLLADALGRLLAMSAGAGKKAAAAADEKKAARPAAKRSYDFSNETLIFESRE